MDTLLPISIEKNGLAVVQDQKEITTEIVEAPPIKRIKNDIMSRSCQFCSSKKHVATGCCSQACKKCCLKREGVCPAHPKEVKKMEPDPIQIKKPVLKNEFREPNFHYYGETLTIFCIRDFFESKKLSQGVLKDQERAERVSGNVWGRRNKNSAADCKIKELIKSALGKRPAPDTITTLATVDASTK
ncbi:hypothetical protein CCR75_003366 [Bremia lactucae]|uniref:Uncharacterized protein n=1 Tax=Bremia lactucae TaxID=4779 RepID=A0A976FIN1_BRELC|nr:hypothetical protein CCR75_003366 [Bremia lactucae]